jgi:hypothetical protein
VSAADRIMKALAGKTPTPMTAGQEKTVRAEVQKFVDELLKKFSGEEHGRKAKAKSFT